MIHTKEIRPGGQTEAKKSSTGQGAGSPLSIPVTFEPEHLARASGFVVLVEDPNGNYRRRPFLTLHSAHKAVERARARGADAKVVLVRLVPVEGGETL